MSGGGAARLSSPLREELKDRPAEVLIDPATPGDVAAVAALVAGEPRRALTLLAALPADQAEAPEVQALQALAARMDANWFPGGTGALLGDDDVAPPSFVMPATGDPAREILLRLLGELLPSLPSLRTIVQQSVRADPAVGRAAVTALTGDVRSLLQLAHGAGRLPVAAFCSLALADLFRLGGAGEEAARYRAWAAVAYEAAGDRVGPALTLLQEADWLLTPSSSPEVLGFDLGNLEWRRLLPDAAAAAAARRCLDEARTRFREAGAPRGEASVDLREAFLALTGDDPHRAGEPLHSAEQRLLDAGDGAGVQHARVLATLAAVAGGRLSAARPGPTLELAAWAETVGSRSFAFGLGRLVHATGKAWRTEGEVERARVTLSLAVDLALAFGTQAAQTEALHDLAELFATLNSRGPAIATFERALAEHLARVGGLDAPGPIEAIRWMGAANLLVGLFREHVGERDPDGIERSATRARQLLARAPDPPATAARLAAAEATGVDLGELRRWNDELSALAAARYVPGTGRKPAADFEARALGLTADALIRIVQDARVLVPQYRGRKARLAGRDTAAQAEFVRALGAARALGPAGRLSEVLVLGTMRDLDAARVVLSDYLDATPGLDPGSVIDLHVGLGDFAAAARVLAATGVPADGAGDWRELVRRGEIAVETNDLATAEPLLRDGVGGFEAWFARLHRDAFRVSVSDDATVRQLYVLSARVALARDRLDESFALGDRLRSLALGDLLRQAAALSGAPPDRSASVLAWSQASAEWTGAYDVLAATAGAGATAEEIAAAQEGLDLSQRRLEDAEARLERAAPELLVGRVSRSLPASPSLDQVRALLPEDTLLVEYLVGADDLVVWAADRFGGEGRWYRLDSRELAGRVRRFHDACANRPGGQVGQDDPTCLAGWLLEPVADRLGDHRRVVVVPSGSLHLLPFHALPLDGEPLGGTHVLSYLPAASLLPYVAGRSRPRLDAGALVVGDPAFAAARRLRRLPGAGVEARAIAAQLATGALTDVDATEPLVRGGIEGRSLVHLATHGLISDLAPTRSAIALAGMDELTVAELMGLAIEADLVVLSACDTGRGEITVGGDVIGLVRGLLAAGARNAVVSLWPVDDEAGCLLMNDMYARLAGGAGTAEALHGAQAAMRATDASSRAAAYRSLADRLEQPGAPAGRRARDAGDDDVPSDHDRAYWWAPFIHVGL